MSTFCPESEVLLRHEDELTPRRVLFAGEIRDDLPAQLPCADVRAHSQMLNQWEKLRPSLGERAAFGLLAEAPWLAQVDTLVYYWPKSKPQAQFQLMQLLSLLPVGSGVFVVGENRGGVRSAVQMLTGVCPLQKVDSARRCGLYYGTLAKPPHFRLDDYWHQYQVDGLTVKTLPGVFSQHGLDAGSALLLSTFDAPVKGRVLDMGCGAGVLAAALAHRSPDAAVSLCDLSAPSLAASRETLAANGLRGEVFASDVFSQVQGRFELIVANPPFHEGLKTSLQAAEQLIDQACAHLSLGGELRLVANGFLPYAQRLDRAFGGHRLLARTASFKVYQAHAGGF